MKDLRRISLLAVLFLVVLRIAIGWHLLYEGLWKYDTMDTAAPWSAEGYLRNAQGPYRDHFREMTGDPDDLGWLDYDTVSARWERWRDRFALHYALDKDQRADLDELLNGAAFHTAGLSELPATVDLEPFASVVTHDAEKKLLIVKGDTPLLPSEAARLKAQVAVARADGADGRPLYVKAGEDGQPVTDEDGTFVEADPVNVAYFKAIERLETLSGRLGYRQKLAAALKGDPDRVGVIGRFLEDRDVYRPEMGSVSAEELAAEDVILRYGEIQVYKDMLAKSEADLKGARTDFQYDHLAKVWDRIQQRRAELVGPVKALDQSLKREAPIVVDLSEQQRQRGPLPPERTQLWAANQRAMWGLIVLGALLIVGLCTRLAALAGAVMLVTFYLVVPPWPGVPQPPGPEHSYIVNKNLIEAVALLGIAALPTGSWFGLDGTIRWLLFGRKKKS